MEVRELATIEHAGRIAKRPSSGELFDDAAPAAKRAAISSVDSASLSGISSAAIEPSLLDMPQTVLLGICAHLRENDRDFGNFLFSSRDLYQRDAVMQARGESALHAKLSKAIARRSRSIAHLPDARRAKCYEALELQVNTLSDFRFGEAHRALIHALRELPATEHFQGLLRLKARLQGRPRAEQYRSLSHIINEISDLHLPAEQHRNIYEWLKNAVFALGTRGDYPALRFLPNVAAELLVPPEREAAFYEMLPFAASQPEYEQFETLRNLIENTSMLSATARAIFAEAVMAQSRNLSTVYRASILRTLINTSAGAFDANFHTLMAFARQQTQQIPPAERGSIAAEFLEVLDRFAEPERLDLFSEIRSWSTFMSGRDRAALVQHACQAIRQLPERYQDRKWRDLVDEVVHLPPEFHGFVLHACAIQIGHLPERFRGQAYALLEQARERISPPLKHRPHDKVLFRVLALAIANLEPAEQIPAFARRLREARSMPASDRASALAVLQANMPVVAPELRPQARERLGFVLRSQSAALHALYEHELNSFRLDFGILEAIHEAFNEPP